MCVSFSCICVLIYVCVLLMYASSYMWVSFSLCICPSPSTRIGRILLYIQRPHTTTHLASSILLYFCHHTTRYVFSSLPHVPIALDALLKAYVSSYALQEACVLIRFAGSVCVLIRFAESVCVLIRFPESSCILIRPHTYISYGLILLYTASYYDIVRSAARSQRSRRTYVC